MIKGLFSKYILQYGDTNTKKIVKAQVLLREAGSNLEINGEYTIGMVSAVRSYQKKHNLEATGKIDKKTWRLLKKELSIWKMLIGR